MYKQILRILAIATVFTSSACHAIDVVIPAYIYPAGVGAAGWNRIIAMGGKVNISAIIDPDNGPGKAVDANYTETLDRAAKAGVKLIGYVYTSYGNRPIADVKADMDRWLKLYPQIKGYFLDEQASGTGSVPYYRELALHAHRILAGSTVISNPGNACAQEYYTNAQLDLICSFEGTPEQYAKRKPAPFINNIPRRQNYLLIHTLTTQTRESIDKLIDNAKANRFGSIYFTDTLMPNPWDRLPAWFEEFCERVKIKG